MNDRLRIGIDGYNLALPHGTGVATYGHALAGTLHRAGHTIEGIYGIDAGKDPDLREALFFDALGNPRELAIDERRRNARRRLRKALNPLLSVTLREIPLTDRVDRAAVAERLPPFDRVTSARDLFALAMRHFGLYGRFLAVRMADPPQVMHWTYPLPIEMVGAHNIYTIHDIVPLRLPYTTLDNKRRYRALLAACIARASRICTVSEASRNDIVNEFGALPAAVTNTWQASPLPSEIARSSAAEDAAAIEGIFDLAPQGYFLFLGAIEPKKNVGRLIEAYLSLSTRTPLVIVGGRGWQSEQETVLLDEHGPGAEVRNLDERVRWLSRLSRPLLMKLIRGAKAVLFPSIYEGFGLPVLEAMQLGTPVLTSRTSSLGEIAGDAAYLVDPYDVADIAAGIRAIDIDAELRSRLSSAGLARSDWFSEDRYLGRLETMYRSCLRNETH